MENKAKKTGKVTIVDVARESGVSYSTVSRVLNGFEYVKESTRQRVQEAVDRLGYVANLQARSLAGGQSQIIGVLVPGLDNGYISEIIRGIDEGLTKVHYDLMLYTTHRHHDKETFFVGTITNGLADGVILVVPLIPDEYLDMLNQQNIPHVLLDQTDSAGKSPTVDSTNWQGAYDATKYLIELHHQRIGFITGLTELNSSGNRLEGYKAALNDYDIPFADELVVEGDFWQPGGYQATQELLNLPTPPTAIFASSDLMAFGAMDAVRERGLRIPEDISIIGFDDIPQALITHPKLTTIHQPLDQMGRVSVQLLLEQIRNPGYPSRRVTLATHLVIRDSCQPLQQT